jgi:hypothetical protein
MQAYLKITAPFDGVVTDRFVHPGALVGPGADPVLLVIQQISHLRLVVPVPEEDVGGTMRGASIPFHVPAYPDRAYTGTVARIAHALDPKTRTMPVELDVLNRDGTLAPGMYPSVKWPVRREHSALFVPKTSVVTTTERTFVIRARNGRAEWVDVKKGAADGDLVEVSGALAAGDKVVRRGTDELRDGMPSGVELGAVSANDLATRLQCSPAEPGRHRSKAPHLWHCRSAPSDSRLRRQLQQPARSRRQPRKWTGNLPVSNEPGNRGALAARSLSESREPFVAGARSRQRICTPPTRRPMAPSAPIPSIARAGI